VINVIFVVDTMCCKKCISCSCYKNVILSRLNCEERITFFVLEVGMIFEIKANNFIKTLDYFNKINLKSLELMLQYHNL